jgi:2-C-methyl-D-erythritol 2,4-cyclodiphosphate synthase
VKDFSIGTGYDAHRLVEGRRLVLGGHEIPFEKGEDGHSDGDVLIHAIIDALLGAAAMGDIGAHFPPSDPSYKDIDSRELLAKTALMIREAGWEIGNIDSIVILERPKIAPYIGKIVRELSRSLGTEPVRISVKGKTKEGLDSVGRGESIEAQAVCLIYRDGERS